MIDIDLIIFSSFLILSLILGIISSAKVRNISEYALGNRNFSTSTLVATIVATWIGAGLFSYTLIETYRQGIYFLVPLMVDSLVLVLIGYFLAPRMGEFLGSLSIAESMGNMFGSKVRMVTVFFSLLRTICFLGVNFQVSAKLLELIFGTSGHLATLMSAFIVITYSALGGIKAVTLTDVIQFFTFGCLMPIVAIIAWQALGESGSSMVWNMLASNPIFDYKAAFDPSNTRFYQMLGMCLFFIIPELEPESFQRISMARSVSQAMEAFKIAGLLCFLFQIIVALLAIFILSDNPNLNPNNLVAYIVKRYTYIGFKGIVAVGIMAMIMSSADSAINSMSVILAHDFFKPLKAKWAKNELIVARIAAIASGIGAMLIALRVESIFELVISFATGLYLPVISIPTIFAIFGFRSSECTVLSAMFGSLITIFLWRTFLAKSTVDVLVPSVIASITFLFGTHYLTGQPGGWVGIKDYKTYDAIKQSRGYTLNKLLQAIKNFNILTFCKRNTPQKAETFFFFGLLAILSSIVSMLSMPQMPAKYANIISFCYASILTLACYLLIYPLWPRTFKNPNFTSIFWILSTFYINIFVNSIFLAVSDGSQVQTAIFFLNLTAILILFRWQTSLFMCLIGLTLSLKFIASYLYLDTLNLLEIKFYLIFCLLLVSCIIITFLKPRQDDNDQNTSLLRLQSKELHNVSEKLLDYMVIRQEFINNINHEVRTPIHHIGASLEELEYNFNNSTDKEKLNSISMLKQGYQRIKNYMHDILDLSEFSNNKVKLKYDNIKFADLIPEVLDQFTQHYLENKDLHFYFRDEAEDSIVNCDKDKISQVLINLLKNAAQYSHKGTVEVVISNQDLFVGHKRLNGLKCSVIDQGVGIPIEEIADIFGPFIQSSRTKNMSGGKGLGLAICEHIIKLHYGQIYAQNNQQDGATFFFIIPLKID